MPRSALSRRLSGAVIGVCAMAAVIGVAAVPAAAVDIGIIVTNGAYQDAGVAKAAYAEKDGNAMAAAMRQVLRIDDSHIHKYRDRTRTQLDYLFGRSGAAARGRVWELVKEANGNDKRARLIVYYSGHGVPYAPRDRPGTIESALLSADVNFDDIENSVYPLQTLRDKWTEDCYHDSYNGAPADGSVWTTDDCSKGRVVRGGAWNLIPANLRAAFRYNYTGQITLIGFRLARTLTSGIFTA
jgi:hypothetical protein